jgi:hypothetical protein
MPYSPLKIFAISISFVCNNLPDVHIKSKLSRVRMFWCTVRHDHLRERETVKQRTQDAVIIVSDGRERDPLALAES